MPETDLFSNEQELQKLCRILELSNSTNDAECLVATRKAQQILSKYGLTYHAFISKLQYKSTHSTKRKIKELQSKIKEQNAKIARLEKRQSSDLNTANSTPRFLGPIQGLKKYLMGNFSLKTHERALLEGIKEIEPKSKEAYMILICARRHGVEYKLANNL
ncbi:hypothetical protein [Pseudemcibacter aquimaris]|uniref:hypothetical protein n=1 Tax=Pseudemcibacter aquimaris TaxID=2857064 RepID=UPI002012953E|nr:hypothetical protein [Pseudemcibacter aquimaris]MCC3861225.1 hypothetical protein [Pseudemcibacter aquimaris]WDU58000.1 hypothetical protein KW060_12445 [Pseudemcibacter aquimaris]